MSKGDLLRKLGWEALVEVAKQGINLLLGIPDVASLVAVVTGLSKAGLCS